MSQIDHDFPAGLSNPALRAFRAAGYNRLAHFSRVTEADLMKLPISGIPRILRPRKKFGTIYGFSLADELAQTLELVRGPGAAFSH